MNAHTLRVLEYDKVRALVADYAASVPGRAAVFALTPSVEPAIVAERLQETQECIWIFMSGEHLPLDGILEVGAAVARLGVSGAVLSPSELMEIATTLGAGRRVRDFFGRFEGKVLR